MSLPKLIVYHYSENFKCGIVTKLTNGECLPSQWILSFGGLQLYVGSNANYLFFCYDCFSCLAKVYPSHRSQLRIQHKLGALHALIAGAFNRSAINTRLCILLDHSYVNEWKGCKIIFSFKGFRKNFSLDFSPFLKVLIIRSKYMIIINLF